MHWAVFKHYHKFKSSNWVSIGFVSRWLWSRDGRIFFFFKDHNDSTFLLLESLQVTGKLYSITVTLNSFLYIKNVNIRSTSHCGMQEESIRHSSWVHRGEIAGQRTSGRKFMRYNAKWPLTVVTYIKKVSITQYNDSESHNLVVWQPTT